MTNKGAEKLAKAVLEYGSQSRLAAALALDQSYLSRLLSGERRPSLTLANQIEKKLGIPQDAWDKPAKALAS